MVSSDPSRIWPAPAKINLFLHVTGRRPNGYHELQTLFQFLDYGDELRVAPTDDGEIERLGAGQDDLPAEDLTIRAARLLQSATSTRAGARIELKKRIPVGAGLGGGSSDAATALIALNRLWGAGLDRAQLGRLGLQLGADVPVFLHGRAAWAEGVGELLTDLAPPEHWYGVIIPPVSVSTGKVFGDPALTRDHPPIKIRDFSSGLAINDLEEATCRLYSEVAETLTWLRQYGEARMSGSGSSLFLACEDRARAEEIVNQRPPGTDGFVARGANRHPLLGV
ncbi:MAG: 4-(cytidine 5'-diphospho)-2-C-methyl-D-erythritol kinase [Pseudomonadota bacterium]|nr:4-(cytidine 5'-diphospho)-2-C-methyl-D-erythritol kinase [Pseudomonadota bacterium]